MIIRVKLMIDAELRQRLITAAIGLPPVIIIILIGGWPFAALIGSVGLLALLELRLIFGKAPLALIFSLAYIAGPLGLLVALRASPNGLFWVALVATLTWVTDAFAYIGGRLHGRRLLWPTVSPHKTVEGALTGWLVGAAAAFALILLAGAPPVPGIALALAGPWAVIAGDLFESALKRYRHVKDSHMPGLDVLPGHGGMLDRIDGLLFVCLLCALAAALGGGNF